MYSGNEWAGGVTSKFARRLRNSRASRSPTSSETLSAAVATAMPKASAAPVRSLCRGRRLKESATSRINILCEASGTVAQPFLAVRVRRPYLYRISATNGEDSPLLGDFGSRLRKRAHIHHQIAALHPRRHANRIASSLLANRRHVNRRPAMAAHHVLPVLAVPFRPANPASVKRCAVSVRLLDDHEAQRLPPD